MSYHPLAQKHNDALQTHPHLFAQLSDFGKGIFFPSQGILAQGAEAQKGAFLYNATIGIATEGGKAMALSTISSQSNLPHAQYLPYAPSYGRPDLRAKWKENGKEVVKDRRRGAGDHEFPGKEVAGQGGCRV